MENDDFNPVLDPDAEALALKLQTYMKSKEGDLLEPVWLTGDKPRYYWSIMTKSFYLVYPQNEMYVLPWKASEKGEVYVYSHGLFCQGQVFLVPKDEIIRMEFN